MNNHDKFEQAARNETERSPEMIKKTPAVRHLQPTNRRAKTTSAWTSGTTTGANLLDSDGNEVTAGFGFGITINFFKTYSADNYPAIANDETIPVFQDINGDWYCDYAFITAVDVDNVLVEFNINTTTKKFQTKKRDNVKVLGSGAVSGYVDEHTGTECP